LAVPEPGAAKGRINEEQRRHRSAVDLRRESAG